MKMHQLCILSLISHIHDFNFTTIINSVDLSQGSMLVTDFTHLILHTLGHSSIDSAQFSLLCHFFVSPHVKTCVSVFLRIHQHRVLTAKNWHWKDWKRVPMSKKPTKTTNVTCVGFFVVNFAVIVGTPVYVGIS